MLFPEFLYRLSQRDEQVTWLDPVFGFDNSGGIAAANLARVIFTVPNDRVLILTFCHINGIPGAAQSAATGTIRALAPDPQATDFTITGFLRDNAHSNTALMHQFNGEILLPSSWRLQTTCDFSAGAAPNQLNSRFGGILIPNANIQRV